jgi:hypothetical protein
VPFRVVGFLGVLRYARATKAMPLRIVGFVGLGECPWVHDAVTLGVVGVISLAVSGQVGIIRCHGLLLSGPGPPCRRMLGKVWWGGLTKRGQAHDRPSVKLATRGIGSGAAVGEPLTPRASVP